jgi:hypothetical protein
LFKKGGHLLESGTSEREIRVSNCSSCSNDQHPNIFGKWERMFCFSYEHARMPIFSTESQNVLKSGIVSGKVESETRESGPSDAQGENLKQHWKFI